MSEVDRKLRDWAQHNKNVLLIGRPGCGKTSKSLNVFKELGLKCAYKSGPTLDPWVDFAGMPEKFTDENGQRYTDLVTPRIFHEGFDVLFIDEFNRAHHRVIDACMEMIQFQSINGRPVPGLKMVWGAINPPDADNHIAPLDPAVIDRFHVHYTMPDELDALYFAKKFGEKQAAKAGRWYNNLSNETRRLVSPRRVEYALSWFNEGGDLTDILPQVANCSGLEMMLSQKAIWKDVEKYLKNHNKPKLQEIASKHTDYVMKMLYYRPDLVLKMDDYLTVVMQAVLRSNQDFKWYHSKKDSPARGLQPWDKFVVSLFNPEMSQVDITNGLSVLHHQLAKNGPSKKLAEVCYHAFSILENIHPFMQLDTANTTLLFWMRQYLNCDFPGFGLHDRTMALCEELHDAE